MKRRNNDNHSKTRPRQIPKKKIRIAFIGAGEIANRVHYPSLASFSDVEIVAVADLDRMKLQSTLRKYGIKKCYTDYQRMIEEVKPDGVYAIGQPHLMYDVWTWCLERGHHLCIEKPMGITLHQARALAYLAQKHGCITQVSFQRRSCPMVVNLYREALQRGPITHAVCSFYKFSPEPYLNARDRILDDGVHAIDTLRWLCGGEVLRVDCVTKRVGTPDINFISALLEFDNGAIGVLLNSWTSGRRIFRVEFHVPGVCVEAEHEGKGTIYADGDIQGVTYDTRETAGSDELYIYGGFQAKNREFIDALKNGTQPPSNFSDALKTMEVAEAILAQATLQDLGKLPAGADVGL